MKKLLIKISLIICVLFALLFENIGVLVSYGYSGELMTAKISGNVWEDLNLTENEYGVLQGNGILDSYDQKIGGMKVELYKIGIDENANDVDIIELGEKVAETYTGADGTYSFDDIQEGGRYRVQFVYGENEGDKYNAQDYKSVLNELPETIDVRTNPVDIVILADLSGSMDKALGKLQKSIKQTIYNILNNELKDYIRISLWSFSVNVRKEVDFTNDIETLVRAVDNFQTLTETNTPCGLMLAENYLEHNSRPYSEKMFMIFTDGLPMPPNNGATTKDLKTGVDAFELMVAGVDVNMPEIDHYYFSEKDQGKVEVPLSYYSQLKRGYSLGGGYAENLAEACTNLNGKTKYVWDHFYPDITKYAIFLNNEYLDTSEEFHSIFGDGANINVVNQTTLYNMMTKNYPTSITVELNKTEVEEEIKAYATDSPNKRLENMRYLQNIEYRSFNGGDTEKVYKMIATSPIITVFNGTTIDNINLALEERPKQSVYLNKEVEEFDINLSDGRNLIHWTKTSGSIKYLQYIPTINDIKGSFLAIMDDELTHGATINIKYKITVANTSEKDNLAHYFTDRFISQNLRQELSMGYGKTDYVQTSYVIHDYLGDSLIYDERKSPPQWQEPTVYTISSNGSNNCMSLQTGYTPINKQWNITIYASKIMAISDFDLNTFENYVEIASFSNILGRRMYDGNQTLTPGNLRIGEIAEADEAKAETISRVPPFGEKGDASQISRLDIFGDRSTTLNILLIILTIEIICLVVIRIKINKMHK